MKRATFEQIVTKITQAYADNKNLYTSSNGSKINAIFVRTGEPNSKCLHISYFDADQRACYGEIEIPAKEPLVMRWLEDSECHLFGFVTLLGLDTARIDRRK